MADRAQRARRTRRGLSQNFLRSRRLADDIVRGLDVRPHELIVEIGAGDGRLTEPLARRARRVIAIELDPALASALRALPVPIIGRIADDRLLLDCRCLDEPGPVLAQLPTLQEALA